MPVPARRLTIRRRAVGLSLASALAVAGCAVGARPTLEPIRQVDDETAGLVIERLERAESVTFTATYDIIPSATGEVTTAIVQQDQGRRRVMIGDVIYRTDGNVTETCAGVNGPCVQYVDDARISDLNLTSRFWSDGFASRLAIDAARRVGFSRGHAETIADQPATCADVPVLGGEVVYCALDAGVLARYFGADVSVELTSFSSQADLGE